MLFRSTAQTDANTVNKLFGAGADDYVSKPIVGPELVTRILNRLERTDPQRLIAEIDPLTGVTNRAKSNEVLRQLTSLAQRCQQPVCLAVLNLDQLEQINMKHGHPAGDQVLRRLAELLLSAFRGENTVARWGGGEFVVGMYGMALSDGVQRLAEVLEDLRQVEFSGPEGSKFRATFSAGVAPYAKDGTDAQTLYQIANEALGRAKAAGGDRVAPAKWRPDQDNMVQNADVVLVDDDEPLASLVIHALTTRGYRTLWLRDGQEAAEKLSGSNPTLKSRVILLDVGLPGLDGLGLLRQLAREASVRRTRVIMLTARASEAEVLAAFELGAFDHVAKPFSLPVLMQRVRRALDP